MDLCSGAIGAVVNLLRPWSRVTSVIVGVLAPVAVAALVGMVPLWPSGTPKTAGAVPAVGAQYVSALVTSTPAQRCQTSEEDRPPNGNIPDKGDCLQVGATVTSGPESGRVVTVWATASLKAVDVPVGTRLTLEGYRASAGQSEVSAWYDVDRTMPLLVLAGILAFATVAVARMRGLRALLGLGIAFTLIGMFMLPALLAGENALLVGLVGSTVIMFVVRNLAHGPTRRTATALLGTLAGVGVTAGLGVLDDVTITQASAVWELRSANLTATRRELFTRAMRIGRDHIASTINTIAFAYVGASLPVLLFVEVEQFPVRQTLTSGDFASEIVRTLAGSTGLVLAIGLTTAIAILVVTAGGSTPQRSRHREQGPIGHVH